MFRQSLFFPLLLCLSFFYMYGAKAQNTTQTTQNTIQWASRLLGFSSEYVVENNKNPYSAKQVLGKPNKLPAKGFSPVAWSPMSENRSVQEWIKVGFKTPMQIRQVAIAENVGAGAITDIYLYDTENNEYLVYHDSVLLVKNKPETARMFCVFLPQTPYKVASVKVVLNPIRILGRNQIDAIAISDSEVPIKAEINLSQQSNSQDNKTEIKLEKLPETLNSNYNELLPVISSNGKTLFFDRQQHPENTAAEIPNDDIWFSEIDETGNWKPAQRLPEPLNNKNNNYVCSVSPDGNTILVANDYNTTNFDLNKPNGGVSIARKNENGTWQMPQKVLIDNYYNLSANAEFYLAHNQKTLLMSIEMEDSQGGRDLYVSFFRHDTKTWSTPKNLGITVNSAATELTPFLAADNETLYFASNGFSGYGETDMFMSKRLDDSWTKWSEPVNLGLPFNSNDWDTGYSIDAKGEYAYFSSYQNSNQSDIFRVKLPTPLQPTPVKQLDLELSTLTVGQTIRLEHIIFEQGTAKLQDESEEELKALLKLLNDNATMEIEVAGHTDIEGSPIENMKLSQERVKTIKNYLVKEGITASRIRTRAYGSQKPITRQRDELSKQLNRRVEVKVVKE